ncbi:HAD family phosphatase [Demequina sp. NBRC 110057]|uniref:HAD family hydrolase n=1 Tax=Demequina sp. NBRC 110057 TaxID=1570346 RepID=UPI00210126E9|nr:HAD-IA family hydrolase [Demequina sp. NBRC 110057]
MTTTDNAWVIPQATERRYGAALFDLDGVLTPTAEVHMRAWNRMFSDYFEAHHVSPAYTDDDYFAYVDGKPRYDGVRACLASRGITLPEGDPTDAAGTETVCGLGNAKNDMFAKVLRDEGIAPYAGSVALIDHLKEAGVPMAVVSSSRNAPEVLAAAGIDHHFEIVVDGAVAARDRIPGKPAPDTYQHAAQLLGVPEGDAVVVEDAISGVQAGAAGDFGLVVGVDRGAGADALRAQGADVVVADLAELIA